MLPTSSHPHDKKAGLAYWAQRVLEECHKASHDFAPDPVHDLRVAIRRCRSMADGFLSVDPDPEWRQMKGLAKPLFSSLGELRDTQVMVEWVNRLSEEGDPVRQVMMQTLSEKESAQKAEAQHALHSFDRHHWSALNTRLAKRTGKVPTEGLVFQELALERWMEAYALHHRALRNRSPFAYHQLRIGIKRFRYTVENFLPQRHEKWAKDLRDLQDALGEVHDFDVLRAMINAHLEISVDDRARWQKRIADERQKRLDLYRVKMLGKGSLWRVWRAELPSGVSLEKAALEKLRKWASFLDPDISHSALVTRIALQLYDALSREGVLPGGREYRRILQAAAMLHNVGHHKGHEGHRKRVYRLILKLHPPAGWSEEELHCVAIVARYHQGALPTTGDSHFVGLSAKRRSELLPQIGILRLAHAFAVEGKRNATQFSVERRDGLLTISGHGLAPIGPTADRLARARYLLEATCKLPIMIRPLPVKSSTAFRRTTRVRRSPASSR